MISLFCSSRSNDIHGCWFDVSLNLDPLLTIRWRQYSPDGSTWPTKLFYTARGPAVRASAKRNRKRRNMHPLSVDIIMSGWCWIGKSCITMTKTWKWSSQNCSQSSLSRSGQRGFSSVSSIKSYCMTLYQTLFLIVTKKGGSTKLKTWHDSHETLKWITL